MWLGKIIFILKDSSCTVLQIICTCDSQEYIHAIPSARSNENSQGNGLKKEITFPVDIDFSPHFLLLSPIFFFFQVTGSTRFYSTLVVW